MLILSHSGYRKIQTFGYGKYKFVCLLINFGNMLTLQLILFKLDTFILKGAFHKPSISACPKLS